MFVSPLNLDRSTLMTISVTCACGKEYRLGDDKAGRQFDCRECGTLIRVPRAERSEPEGTADGESDQTEVARQGKFVPATKPKKRTSQERERPRAEEDSGTEATVDRKRLIVGLGIAAAVLVVMTVCWFTSAKGLLLEAIPIVLFAVAVCLLFGVENIRAFVGGLFVSNRDRIQADLDQYGGTVKSISWRPHQLVFLTHGWNTPRHSMIFFVRYTDREGNAKSSLCAVSYYGRVAWDNEYGGWSSTPIEFDLSDIGKLAGRVCALFLLLMCYVGYQIGVYSFLGETTAATVTSTRNYKQTVHSRPRRGPRTTHTYDMVEVRYSFQDRGGVTREGSFGIRAKPHTDAGKVELHEGSTLNIEYVPGAFDWWHRRQFTPQAYRGEAFVKWLGVMFEVIWMLLKVLLMIASPFALLYGVIKGLDYFDVFKLHKKRRRKQTSDDG